MLLLYKVLQERGRREGDREHDGEAASITDGLVSVDSSRVPLYAWSSLSFCRVSLFNTGTRHSELAVHLPSDFL